MAACFSVDPAEESSLLTAGTFADGTIEKPEHVECAFAAYDAIGRPRTLKVVNTSRENGEICMMRGECIGRTLARSRQHWMKGFIGYGMRT